MRWFQQEEMAVQVLNVGKGTGLAALLNIDAFEEGDYLVMLTKNGLIKRTPSEGLHSGAGGWPHCHQAQGNYMSWLAPMPA